MVQRRSAATAPAVRPAVLTEFVCSRWRHMVSHRREGDGAGFEETAGYGSTLRRWFTYHHEESHFGRRSRRQASRSSPLAANRRIETGCIWVLRADRWRGQHGSDDAASRGPAQRDTEPTSRTVAVTTSSTGATRSV